MNRGDVIGVALIIVLVALLGSVGAFAFYLSQPQRIDPDTLCPTNRAVGHSVFLIDRTDPLTENHFLLLSNALARERVALEPDEQLSVFLITETSNVDPRPIFSRCKPKNGDDANPLYQNQRLLRTVFDETFHDPLSAMLTKLREPAQAQSSPIMETIVAVVLFPSFANARAPRRLIIVSDLLQNVAVYSHYRTAPDYEQFRRSPYAESVSTSLAGIEVEIVYLNNQTARERQGAAHLEFWRNYFNDAGAETVTIIDLDYFKGKNPC